MCLIIHFLGTLIFALAAEKSSTRFCKTICGSKD
jgi:hypothetical protein